ncbi:MAG: GNAT family N-acetyltransferase [Janthinobacterium lividum]
MAVVKNTTMIHFEKITPNHKTIILNWLNEPHVREFWDNSPEHVQDILDFTNNRPTPSLYLDGIYHYWIGYKDHHPYCLFMTADVTPKVICDNHLPDLWTEHLSPFSKTMSVDFFIGYKAYLGQGYAVPTLNAFITFYKENIDSTLTKVYISPDDQNLRAIHVYRKADFKQVGKFQVSEGTFSGHQNYLMVKDS